MKKPFTILALSVVCFICALGFAACKNGDKIVDTHNKQIVSVYNAYITYAEENGITPKSYEEWLALIKGEKGDKGDKGDTGAQGEKGADGINGADGKDGQNGKDGTTPTIEISEEGFWIINGEKTDFKAVGQDGESAADGVSIVSAVVESGDLIITLTDETIINAGKVYNYENSQELDFFLKDDGTYEVKVGNAVLLSNIVIPDTYKGRAITSIGERGFYECKNLINISMPDSITNIGEDAFNGCTKLKNIIMPNSVSRILDRTFYNCSQLTSITLSNTVSNIGEHVFYGCTCLGNIVFNGTKSQWKKIKKADYWGSIKVIHCIDGDI